MKYWVISIFLLIVLILVVLKTDIINKILFSNKTYAKNIEVKTYILTQEQVAELFKDSDKEPIQLTVQELNKNNINYFVLRVKNLSNSHAWGTVSCKARTIHKPFKIPIFTIKNQFSNNILDIRGTVIAEAFNSSYPDISYEWSELYTK
jgi:hypothetical protein